MRIYIHPYTFTCVTFIYICLCICILVGTYTYIHEFLRVRIRIYIQSYIYACVKFIYIHMCYVHSREYISICTNILVRAFVMLNRGAGVCLRVESLLKKNCSSDSSSHLAPAHRIVFLHVCALGKPNVIRPIFISVHF